MVYYWGWCNRHPHFTVITNVKIDSLSCRFSVICWLSPINILKFEFVLKIISPYRSTMWLLGHSSITSQPVLSHLLICCFSLCIGETETYPLFDVIARYIYVLVCFSFLTLPLKTLRIVFARHELLWRGQLSLQMSTDTCVVQ